MCASRRRRASRSSPRACSAAWFCPIRAAHLRGTAQGRRTAHGVGGHLSCRTDSRRRHQFPPLETVGPRRRRQYPLVPKLPCRRPHRRAQPACRRHRARRRKMGRHEMVPGEADELPAVLRKHAQTGSAVECLMSDKTMLDVTSWIPGSCESFSKKNCSYALMSSATIRSRKSTLPSST